MSKITPDHLNRQAFVYVWQSTRDQLRQHHESRRRQYGLADRARKLGWSEPVIVDDDLGRSGSGTARPGFERLLVAICEGRVGIVFAAEASRLARNGRDWHTLLEFCGLVNCLLADEQTIYDPRLPNDRLLLGHARADVGSRTAHSACAPRRRDPQQGGARRVPPPSPGRTRLGRARW